MARTDSAEPPRRQPGRQLLDLPFDVLEMVFRHLGPTAMFQVRLVSRAAAALVYQSRVHIRGRARATSPIHARPLRVWMQAERIRLIKKWPNMPFTFECPAEGPAADELVARPGRLQRVLAADNVVALCFDQPQMLRNVVLSAALHGVPPGGLCELDLSHSKIKTMVDLREVARPRMVEMCFCDLLRDVGGLDGIAVVDLSHCASLVDVSPLSKCIWLSLAFCAAVKDVSMLGRVRHLSLRGCTISDVSGLGLPTQRTLDLSRCIYVTDVSSLSKLWALDLRGSTRVQIGLDACRRGVRTLITGPDGPGDPPPPHPYPHLEGPP